MTVQYIVVAVVTALYVLLNFKYDIQMLQQNSYRLDRYWRWLKPNLMNAWRLEDVAMVFLLLATTLLPLVASSFLAGLLALVKIYLIFKKKYKKPLVFTNRVKRIYAVTGVLAAGAMIASALCLWDKSFTNGTYSGIGVTYVIYYLIAIFSWLPVMLAVVILSPVEKSINARYRKEAMDILRSMPDLTVIGVTGSYGKTSTKHYLNRILSESFDVLMTPGSYNTPMGVIRTVREMMKPYNQIFICEMGAKQNGDIKEICDMVNPKIGIITAVGPMHLESFKSMENVQATKFELADALPADGLAVVNNDFEYCASRKVDNVECLRYGVADTKGCDLWAEDIRYTPGGTEFTAKSKDGLELRLFTRLVGECNISNLLAAIAVAIRLGVPHDKIKYAVGRIEQVEHRLNMKQTAGGVTIIDDAFNSNPSGARMAVDVLSHFKESGKRIIVTPGMIELGKRQAELNKELGRHIGKNVDVAIVVGQYNREALSSGIREGGLPGDALHEVGSFAEAQQLLAGILAKGDTVLYENDLPDTFK